MGVRNKVLIFMWLDLKCLHIQGVEAADDAVMDEGHLCGYSCILIILRYVMLIAV